VLRNAFDKEPVGQCLQHIDRLQLSFNPDCQTFTGIFINDRQHGGAYGDGIDYAYTMVKKAPQTEKNPHVV
jgi:hypothetical protein